MDINQPVESIKGVGEKTSAALKKAGIFTIRDLLYYLPRAYNNYQSATKIADLRPGKVVVKGKISDIRTRRTSRRGLSITEAVIRDDTDAIRVLWFNQPYRAKSFIEGKEYYFSGEYLLKNGRYQLQSPTTQIASENTVQAALEAFQPVYRAHGSLNSQFFTKLLGEIRADFSKIPDLLPFSSENPTYTASGVRQNALYAAHFPKTPEEANEARAVLGYEELFEYILAAQLNKNENHKLKAEPCAFNAENTKKLIASLPFSLTDAQRAATWEILQDMAKPVPMNRLLQGDVGAGKTVVAAIAAYQAICAGHQVALLAPTAILATQHAESLAKLLEPFGVSVSLLIGSTRRKNELKKHIADGSAQLIVGTHAIITDDTVFHSLGLAIIDEQHRFGVGQRQKLVMKSNSGASLAPHLLMMTATPIPRSLQLAVFGDLDVSTLRSLPKGRQPIVTKILNEISIVPDLYPKIREAVARHEQVYWICKAIEDNPQSETASVKKQAKKLQLALKDCNVAYLHGRMKPDEKDQIMTEFAKGNIDILVSTTVVEVGVNVPNATQMVIMDAENFGLAQLHQLRGRVGRGEKASSCYLIVDGENPPSRRLRELEKSTDGFHLAEVDLKIRGPGEIYGALQHGALSFRIANLGNTDVLVRASRHAKAFAAELAKTPELMLQYKELQQNISKYQQLTTLN